MKYLSRLLIVALLAVSGIAFADFNTSYDATAQIEGGFVDHADDRGGRTYYGIAEKRWPGWHGWALIDKELATRGKLDPRFNSGMAPTVKKFYFKNFWQKIRADSLGDDELAGQLYDIAVNQGTGSAGKYLQRALNLLNRGQTDYKDLSVDGGIGPATMRALTAFMAKRSTTTVSVGDRQAVIGGKYQLMLWISHQKNRRYFDLATGSNSQESFFNGWSYRSIQEYVDLLVRAGILK